MIKIKTNKRIRLLDLKVNRISRKYQRKKFVNIKVLGWIINFNPYRKNNLEKQFFSHENVKVYTKNSISLLIDKKYKNSW